jgi:hypothetical protein
MELLLLPVSQFEIEHSFNSNLHQNHLQYSIKDNPMQPFSGL